MKKLQRGSLYLTNGQVILVKPEDGKEFTLKELQTAVGGYIEPVIPLDKRSKLFVNEEGLIHNLPKNGHTQAIVNMKPYEFGPNKGFTIRGNAVSTYRVTPGEEGDLGRMLIKEAV